MSGPDVWLQALTDSVAQSIALIDDFAPFGCHFFFAEGVWEITLFAESSEVVGGPKDGAIRKSRFGVHITEVLALFEKVKSCTWQAQSMGEDDDLGPHLAIEGIYEGREVWLRVLAEPPAHFPNCRVSEAGKLVNEEGW